MPRLVLLFFLLTGLLSGCADNSELASPESGDELVVVTRNTPTTYYFEGDRASGFDYALIRQFAREHNLSLRIKVAFSLPEVFDMIASGQAHLAAAGLSQSAERDARFLASEPYLEQQPLVVYKSGAQRPKTLRDLVDRDIVIVAGSGHAQLLMRLREDYPELSWREVHAADSLELMQLITEEKAELAVVDSIEFSVQQPLFPRVVAAMEIGTPTPIVWYLPQSTTATQFLETVNGFISDAGASGFIAQLRRQHFGRYENVSRVGSLTFQRKIQSDLPAWRTLLETVADEYQMDWRLLAAIAYQESHWNPTAHSRTGVEGMMMLTRATASPSGIHPRPSQAVAATRVDRYEFCVEK